MAGSRALRKLQLGKETTAGTAVAATVIYRGLGVIHDKTEVVFPVEDVGYLGGTTRSYVSRYWSELNMPDVEATFEELPYLFEAGVAAEVATRDGTTGSGYIYNYVAPTTAQNTIQTYTIEGGDDQQAEEFDYAHVTNIHLSGEGQGALMMGADWFGRQASNTTFTAALTPQSVEEILVNNGYLYIDDSGGSVGATTVSDTLFGIDLSWSTGQQAFWAVDGSQDFNLVKGTEDEIMLNLTYEHNASAVTEKAKYRDGSVRLMRLKFEGASFTTAGTTYSKKTLIFDCAGIYEDWSALEEVDGNDIVKVSLRVRYSTADSLKADMTIVNALSALA